MLSRLKFDLSIEQLRELLALKQQEYKNAINNGQVLEEVKKIVLEINELKKEIISRS